MPMRGGDEATIGCDGNCRNGDVGGCLQSLDSSERDIGCGDGG